MGMGKPTCSCFYEDLFSIHGIQGDNSAESRLLVTPAAHMVLKQNK